MNLEKLTTETRNDQTMKLDELSTAKMMQIMNDEDKKVAFAVEKELPEITKVVEMIIISFKQNGRLIYMGAGTSGRLGVLDAAECVPTFGVDPNMVQGLIAGGMQAMTVAVEGAEDSRSLGKEDLQKIELTDKDTVIGIAASGRTPYVIGGLEYANQIKAKTAVIACNKGSEISRFATYSIEVDAGPEILTGSTRLKSGTAQKLILNMLSTGAMIGIGKVYQNLMVDVKPTNEKLEERSKQIIMQATDCSYELASRLFEESGHQVKVAIVMMLTNTTKEQSEEKLIRAEGFIRKTQHVN